MTSSTLGIDSILSQRFPRRSIARRTSGAVLAAPLSGTELFSSGLTGGFRQVAGVFESYPEHGAHCHSTAIGSAGNHRTDPQIPAGTKRDPIAAQLFKLYPLPNIAGAGPGAPNYLFDPSQTQVSHTGDARVDHWFSARDSFYGRYTVNNVETNIPNNLPSVSFAETVISPGSGNYGFSGPPKILPTTSNSTMYIFLSHSFGRIEGGIYPY